LERVFLERSLFVGRRSEGVKRIANRQKRENSSGVAGHDHGKSMRLLRLQDWAIIDDMPLLVI